MRLQEQVQKASNAQMNKMRQGAGSRPHYPLLTTISIATQAGFTA